MKYWLLFKTYMQNTLTYPVSFWLWRTRQFLSTFTAITIWLAIFQHTNSVFNYTQEAMVSYIFLTGFLQSMILATQLSGLAQQIYNGEISNLFVKPMSVMGSLISQELADKSYNFTFTILETFILIQIFHPNIVIPNLMTFGLFVLSTLMGAALLFLIMLIFGTVGFWSPDTWGPRFLFYMFVDFTAGKLYPLNILPDIVQKIIFLTPFPYLSYVQTQIFLGHMSITQIVQSLAVLSGWLLACFLAYKHLWNTGLREYGAMGR
jgi:ABC-2 type transport system permease protein